jgi:YD repeat-containing protein
LHLALYLTLLVLAAGSVAGRIECATDPAGKAITYAYNPAGELASVTDREGGITRFDYSRATRTDTNGSVIERHLLTTITDPNGKVVASQEFDAYGRLIGSRDADGVQAKVAYDEAANRQKVRRSPTAAASARPTSTTTPATSPTSSTPRASSPSSATTPTATRPPRPTRCCTPSPRPSMRPPACRPAKKTPCARRPRPPTAPASRTKARTRSPSRTRRASSPPTATASTSSSPAPCRAPSPNPKAASRRSTSTPTTAISTG